MSVLIDVPQVAYKTWSLQYLIKDKDGKRDYFAELEAERDLRNRLSGLQYSRNHEHVR